MTFKCINCENYNRHNPTKIVSVNHSALDRKCPSLHAVLEKTDWTPNIKWTDVPVNQTSKGTVRAEQTQRSAVYK